MIAEKLDEKHDIQLSRETVRQWLLEAGIWRNCRQRRKRIHQPRYRRECFGELIQIDGSQHRWFEDRGPKCTLLVYIDDATGRLLELRFTDSESTFDYFHSTRRYLEQHGKPVAFYRRVRSRSIDLVPVHSCSQTPVSARYRCPLFRIMTDSRRLF